MIGADKFSAESVLSESESECTGIVENGRVTRSGVRCLKSVWSESVFRFPIAKMLFSWLC